MRAIAILAAAGEVGLGVGAHGSGRERQKQQRDHRFQPDVAGIAHAHRFTAGSRGRVELTNIDVTNTSPLASSDFAAGLARRLRAAVRSRDSPGFRVDGICFLPALAPQVRR